MDDPLSPFFNRKIYQLVGDETFYSWKQQMFSTVHEFNLEVHLVDHCTISGLLVSKIGDNVHNPEFTCFQQRDSALALW